MIFFLFGKWGVRRVYLNSSFANGTKSVACTCIIIAFVTDNSMSWWRELPVSQDESLTLSLCNIIIS